jgi:hypothetical protein
MLRTPIACCAALLFGAATALHAEPERSSLAESERIWLAAHNQARAEFGSEPLRWSPALAEAAHSWALTLAARQELRHAERGNRNGAGENLWMGTRGHFAPEQMIASFVGERQHFVAGRFPQVSRTGNWGDVGHYTQIVWPSTREVGCAQASAGRYDVLVCRYWPAGNMIGTLIAPGQRIAAN